MRFLLAIALIAACMLLSPTTVVDARLSLPAIISSNMVLQRGNSAVIWGWTDKCLGTIFIELSNIGGGSAWSTTANATGAWSYNLASEIKIPASTGYTLTIRDTDSVIVLKNIAFGDVILCSGQSNMELTVRATYNATREIADSINYPNLRMFSVGKAPSLTPLETVSSKSTRFNWTVSRPRAFNNSDAWQVFSALCYYTGRDLYKSLGEEVPIGMVVAAWGGTFIESWSSDDALSQCVDPDAGPSLVEEIEAEVASEVASIERAFKPTSFSSSSSPVPRETGPNNSTALWNGMIHPILQMRFHLAIWYQGESNFLKPQLYKCRFPAMITDWRNKFDLPLPFFFVQLAAFPDADMRWPEQQIAQTAALLLPLTGMASAIDLGDPDAPESSIHPRDKQTIAVRMVRSILNVAYKNTSVIATGPLPMSISGVGQQPYRMIQLTLAPLPSADELNFDKTEQCSECCRQNPFEVLLAPSMEWARATTVDIIGRTVNIGVPHLPHESSVVVLRYAYQPYAECALYNSVDIPMTPFVHPVPENQQVHNIVSVEQ